VPAEVVLISVPSTLTTTPTTVCNIFQMKLFDIDINIGISESKIFKIEISKLKYWSDIGCPKYIFISSKKSFLLCEYESGIQRRTGLYET
jgi:hypothetical protein